MNNKTELKNTFYDLIYLRDISNPKLQKLLNQNNSLINSHLYNAGSLICENKLLDKDIKEILYNHIKENLKDDISPKNIITIEPP